MSPSVFSINTILEFLPKQRRTGLSRPLRPRRWRTWWEPACGTPCASRWRRRAWRPAAPRRPLPAWRTTTWWAPGVRTDPCRPVTTMAAVHSVVYLRLKFANDGSEVFSQKTEKMKWSDRCINLIMTVISLCVCMLSHHIVHLKHILLHVCIFTI